MRMLIDVVCTAGHITRDEWVDTATGSLPSCANGKPGGKAICGLPTQRAWLSAPSITPNGTRPERVVASAGPLPVDKKRIAEETTFEIEQKWNRFSDPQVAEQHVSREINEAAGIADAAGNEIPIPKPAPIMFEKPKPSECAK